MSETIGNERVAGAPLTVAERAEVAQIEARWRTLEATPEFREMEANVEARIESSRIGEADDHVGRLSLPRAESAIERAEAMQQAREHAFTHQPINDNSAHEQHRSSAATSTVQHTL